MSHFLIYVSDADKVKLKEQLEPFNENTENEKYVEREYFCKAGEYWQYYEREILPGLTELIENKDPYWQTQKPVFEQVKRNFENAKNDDTRLKKLILEEEGGNEDDNGNLYYLEPKNPKWDWYEIGGRWQGWLRTTNGKDCNEAKKAQIDPEKMREREIEREREWYRKAKATKGEDWYKHLDFFQEFEPTVTEQEFVDKMNIGIVPYGYLHNGVWVDREDTPDFENKFKEWWESLDPNTLITCVDCHI